MEMLILVALWVCCGFACANIAGNKNRSSQTWFFLGVLFGIFAVVTISMLPPV